MMVEEFLKKNEINKSIHILEGRRKSKMLITEVLA